MVRDESLVKIQNINKKIECDGFSFFRLYTDPNTREKELFICYTNNDKLYLKKIGDETYFFESDALSEMVTDIELQSFEKCANLRFFYINSEKHNANLSRFDKGYFYAEVATNLGVNVVFEVETSDYGRSATIKYFGISAFLSYGASSNPAPYIHKKTSKNQENEIKVSKHTGDFEYGDKSIKKPSLDEFKDNVTAVSNYFTNLNNYTVGGWGGTGAVKGVREESNRRSRLKRYVNGLAVVGRYPIVEVVWGAGLVGNKEVSAFTTDTSLPPTYVGVMPSDDELFDMMFNKAEKMFFIPPTISFTKNGNDLKFNDNVSVDLVDDFIFLYLELGKKIKE